MCRSNLNLFEAEARTSLERCVDERCCLDQCGCVNQIQRVEERCCGLLRRALYTWHKQRVSASWVQNVRTAEPGVPWAVQQNQTLGNLQRHSRAIN